MDRRDRAQRAHRQVERRAFGAHLRFDRHRFGERIADDAEAVAQIEAPGLLRDVGARIAQAVEAFVRVLDRFRDDRAAFVGLETIDHHPVETEQVAQAIGGLLAQVIKIGRQFKMPQDRLEHPQLAIHLLRRARLDLDDREAVARMDGAVERALAADEMDGEQPFDAGLIVQQAAGAPDRGHGLGREQAAQLRPDLWRFPDPQYL